VTLLRVENLGISFGPRDAPTLYAVNGVSFSIRSGEAVAIVGESGCGKSVTALSMLGLLPASANVSGSIELAGHPPLLTLSTKRWAGIRGNEISMVFQDPGSALNPVMRVHRQVSETIRRHRGGSRREADQQARHHLRRVGIGSDETAKYPHEMSGGQRQRVMIAIAIACEPKLLIADEPTTALDVTTQAQIVELVKEVSTEMSVLWITHDLALAATLVDRVLVMYAGQIVEEVPVGRLFSSPAHPYTRALLGALPSVNSMRGRPLRAIEGSPPELHEPPVGCSFHDRCVYARDSCRTAQIVPERRGAGHYVSCLRADAVASGEAT